MPAADLATSFLRRTTLGLVVCASLSLASCSTDIPTATPQEWSDCRAWAAIIPPEERDKIVQDTYAHTAWGEKKKVTFMTQQFRGVAAKEKERQARQQEAASRPTSRPNRHEE